MSLAKPNLSVCEEHFGKTEREKEGESIETLVFKWEFARKINI
jgi:hypothetical protein